MDTVVELERQRVCRVMSARKGRFTVENLNHVRCALISDNENLGLLEKATTSVHYDDSSKTIDSQAWICPVILLACRTPNIGPMPYEVMKQLKDLSRNSKVFRCMESTGLGRTLLRHCFAVALMAARPFLATTRAENDVCIKDGLEKRRENPPRMPSMDEKIPSIETLQNKSPFRKSCRIQ
ncbi:hypothetical protein TELCIR_16517 [Teladorsagia circumcincta]|uniref:Uncharacterized protein n=1 Tax=Teladorsagia circumcincta TaxID=45464 RepID=A0A2G9TVE0_TELCI|nr:hypothetical protein TELCIR_16517 [Teladorsagia circumcincta]